MRRAAGWVLVVWLAGCFALATAATDDTAERQRIAAERAVVEQRFNAALAVCQTRFMVTDCLDRARAERRQALDQLQRQTLLLDDEKRRARAAQRLQAIQRRDAEASQRSTATATTKSAAASASAPIAGQRPARELPRAAAPSSASASAAAQQRQMQFQRRQEAARLHELAVQQRNARQDAKRPPAAGLPVPGASAAAP